VRFIIFFCFITFFTAQPEKQFFYYVRDSLYPCIFLNNTIANSYFQWLPDTLMVTWKTKKISFDASTLYHLHREILKKSGREKSEILYHFLQGRTQIKSTGKNSDALKRIMIDPGHVACSFSEAYTEKKFIKMHPKDPLLKNTDTLFFYEADYTGKTAKIVGTILKKEGFQVEYTRNPDGGTAFGVCFDSLYLHRSYYEKKYSSFFDKNPDADKMDKRTYFREVFLKADLKYRKYKIERFNPDLLVCIHFNVDENNRPWNHPVNKNYSMAFIPGAIDEIPDEDTMLVVKILSLMLDETIKSSSEISSAWIEYLNRVSRIPPAKGDEASYVKKNCIPAGFPGVFHRSLAMTLAFPCPVLYGEAFLMDSYGEIIKSGDTIMFSNFSCPVRLYQVAQAYVYAIQKYFKK